MTDASWIAVQYLRPPRHCFWQWQDEGQVLAWTGGQTIGFRGELEQVLRRLAPGGLPPLSAVVLLLAACRENWREASGTLGTLAGTLVSVGRRDLPKWLPDVLAGLDRVRALPENLRSTIECRVELAAMVFEACGEPMVTPREAESVLQSLAQGPPEGPRESPDPWSQSLTDLLWSLECLRIGLPKVDAEALALRLRTGLEQPPRPANLDTPAGARGLIARLLNDQELGGLARLARNLMAAVTLPRPIAEREDLPLGGVSDIANRGPLDRLLLSELAHDDLTLAVRVAVNEALYLRREAPPRNPPWWRAVLIDCGLRTWGIPRVFATAVALAFSATTDAKTHTVAFRAAGRRVQPIDLQTREGLIAHLEALEPEAHPGDALPAFVEALHAGQQEAEADPVLITGEDVLADREFQQALSAAGIPLVYVATVSREGRFQLLARGLRGSKPIREARLNLHEILAPPKRPTTPLVRKDVPKDLPAICRIDPFPLRLPHQIDPRRVWTAEGHGLMTLAKDRRLLLWDTAAWGPRQILEAAPAGTVLCAAPTVEGRITWAVIGNDGGPATLLFVDVENGQWRECRLQVEGKGRQAIAYHAGMLLAIYRRRVDLLEMNDGRRVGSLSLPADVTWSKGRFFHRPNQWLALSHDGMQPRLEPVPIVPPTSQEPVVSLFDCPGRDGPMALLRGGGLYDCARGKRVALPQGLTGPVLGVSPDGRRMLVWRQGTPPAGDHCCVEIPTGRVTPCRRHEGKLALSGIDPEKHGQFLHHAPLRWRFVSVYAASGCLVLVSHGGTHWALEMDPDRRRLRLAATPSRHTGHSPEARFEPAPSAPGAHYRLRIARWSDGSCAWTDSRGLLHLKGRDPKLAELTFVLCEGEMAGWSSDDRVFGPRFYLGDQPSVLAAEVYSTVLQPLASQIGASLV